MSSESTGTEPIVLDYAGGARPKGWRWSAQTRAAKMALWLLIATIVLFYGGFGLAEVSDMMAVVGPGKVDPPQRAVLEYVGMSGLYGSFVTIAASFWFSIVAIRDRLQPRGFVIVVLIPVVITLTCELIGLVMWIIHGGLGI